MSDFWNPEFDIAHRGDGTILMVQRAPLPAHPRSIPDSLVRWATERPDAVYLAERDKDGGWRKMTYAQVLARVRSIGTALLDLGLGPDRPVLILSGNSIDHALLGLAAQYVGVPYAPLSTAYSLVSEDHGKLKDIAALLKPGLVYADDGAAYARAISAIAEPDRRVAASINVPEGGVALAEMIATPAGPQADAAFAALTPDSVGKYLFTSGSTGSPKAVINSQCMMTANQAMVVDCYRFMAETPPIVVDWAPWNHTASGNKVFNMVLTNGGTYYIDNGRPTPKLMAETIRNLREISPTWYFNVPAGYDMLVEAMEDDAALRDSFFARLKMAMYAGAGMAQHTWDALKRLSVQAGGTEVLVATGLGATETGPFALMCTDPQDRPGNVGVPSAGVTLKLVPNEGKLEARLKCASIMPGYYGDPEKTADVMDDEGFYCLGDALKPADPDDLTRGFFFDGRVAENFKLRTGTWVAVGPLRAALVDAMGGLIRDAVILGEDRDVLGALVLPNPEALARLAPGKDLAAQAADPRVRAAMADRLAPFADAATGSATRVRRLIVLDTPPDLDKGEVTDKGSINQRAVIRHRGDLVEAMYADDPRVIEV